MSLNTELSGIAAAQTSIDTIGNNIANMNTEGFKASYANFGALVGASMNGASGANSVPGQGVTTEDLSQLFTGGNVTSTGNSLDLDIVGNGFFQVQNGSGLAYTRAGSMQVDTNGFLVTDQGAKVMGFQGAGAGSLLGSVGPIQISKAALPATATANVGMSINLPATDPAINTVLNPFSTANPASYNESATTTVYDTLGVGYTLTTYYTSVAGSGSPTNWATNWQLSDTTGASIATGGGPTLTFNSSGVLTSGTGATGAIGGLPDGAAALNINLDYTGSSLSNQAFDVSSITNDGSAAGNFTGVQIGSDGQVTGQYSNGGTKVFGTVALANFANLQGLIPTDGTLWLASNNSGPPVLGAPGTGALGTIRSGALEGSNVDLSTQLVNLIVAQQAFQANAQAINYEQQNVQHLLNIQ